MLIATQPTVLNFNIVRRLAGDWRLIRPSCQSSPRQTHPYRGATRRRPAPARSPSFALLAMLPYAWLTLVLLHASVSGAFRLLGPPAAVRVPRITGRSRLQAAAPSADAESVPREGSAQERYYKLQRIDHLLDWCDPSVAKASDSGM